MTTLGSRQGYNLLRGLLLAIGALSVGLSGVCALSTLMSLGGLMIDIFVPGWLPGGTPLGPGIWTQFAISLVAGLIGGLFVVLAGKLGSP